MWCSPLSTVIFHMSSPMNLDQWCANPNLDSDSNPDSRRFWGGIGCDGLGFVWIRIWACWIRIRIRIRDARIRTSLIWTSFSSCFLPWVKHPFHLSPRGLQQHPFWLPPGDNNPPASHLPIGILCDLVWHSNDYVKVYCRMHRNL